jgi:heme-degrading monooxygenase HmoA
MISRIWHGWTTPANADKYERLLKEEILIGIMRRHIHGLKDIQLLRRDVQDEVEFVTIMVFDSLDAVRNFAGEDYEAAVVPEKARAVLSHFDKRSQHYEIRSMSQSDRENNVDLSFYEPLYTSIVLANNNYTLQGEPTWRKKS